MVETKDKTENKEIELNGDFIVEDEHIDYIYSLYKSFLFSEDNTLNINLPRYMFRQIIVKFNNLLADKIIKDNLEIRMPFRLGYLGAISFRRNIKLNEDGSIKNRLRVDWKSTLELFRDVHNIETSNLATLRKEFKKYRSELKDEGFEIPSNDLIYYFNNHTDGIISRIFWDKSVSTVKHSRFFTFKPARAVRKKFADYIRSNNKTYRLKI